MPCSTTSATASRCWWRSSAHVRIDEFESAATELGVALKTVSISHRDADSHGSAAILVRLDHIVSWVDDGSASRERDVLSRLAGLNA